MIRIPTLLSCVLALAADVPPPTGTVVPPGAKLEPLFSRTAPIKGGLTEGPASAPDGRIFFSDIPIGGDDKGMILIFDPKSKKTSVFAENSHKSNGLAFDPQGRLVAAEGTDKGGRGIARYDITTGERTVLVDRYMGKRFNAPNDLTIDTQGRIYFSDPKYVGSEPRELDHMSVYRLNPDGKVVELTNDISKPNGVELSPDGKTLYVADHDNGTDMIDPSAPAPKRGRMALDAFPLDEHGDIVGAKSTLIDFGDRAGIDGMCVDVRGNLYLAVRDAARPGIMVVDPKGKEIAFIPTGASQPGSAAPVGLPSNCCFGRGDDASTLYVTVDVGLQRIKLMVPGHQIK